MQQAPRTVAVIAGIAVTIAAAWIVYGSVKGSGTTSETLDRGAVAVEVARIELGPISDAATFASNLIARSTFDVAPKISGRLERLDVDVGDSVVREQVIAWLDQGEFAQNVEEARAELRVARAALEEARSAMAAADREHARMQSLREQEVASDSELDGARSSYEMSRARVQVAEAQVSQREAALRAAEVRLGDTEIRVAWPNNGRSGPRIVAQRYVDEGAMLSANTPILSVVDLNILRAVFFVTERDYHRMRVGQSARVSVDSLPGQTFEGKVTRLSPVFRETSRQAEVVVEIPNPQGTLKPGMFARVHIEFARADEATLVPTSAIVQRRNQPGVFVTVDGHSVRFVPVTLGIQNAGRVQVIEPEELHGAVVVLGQHLVQDGSAILTVDDDPLTDAPVPVPAGATDANAPRTSTPEATAR